MNFKKESFRGESAEWVGQELEEAYAKEFGGQITGGYGDGGKDLKLDVPEVSVVQIKSSWEGAKKFFSESLRREKFIPVCIGEPGSKDEMVEAIKRYGAWVGHDVPNRDALLEKIAKIKELCYNKKRLLEELAH